ncbi:hypothetical protein [Methanospirillum sp.]
MTSDNPSSITLPDMALAGDIYRAVNIHFIRVIPQDYRLPMKIL